MKRSPYFFTILTLLLSCIPSLVMAALNPWQENRETGFDVIVNQAPNTLPLLTILLEFSDLPHREIDDPSDPDARDQHPSVVEDQIFGCDNDPAKRCMNGYWRESSYNRFEFRNVGHFIWITAWDDPDTPDVDEATVAYWDSVHDYGAGKFRWWGLRSLDEAGFSFGEFDTDNDGHINLGTELAVHIVDSRTSTGGSSRDLLSNAYNEEGLQVPNWPPDEEHNEFFRLDDLSFSGQVAVTHGGNVDNHDPFYIFAHELGHSVFGFQDLYPAGRLPEPIWYTLYGGPNGPHHLDPFQRFKIGWLEPVVVLEDGWYTINDVETTNEAYLLHNPEFGTDEYFLVENRWAGNSYDNGNLTPPNTDSNIEDEGLFVWHVDESRQWNGNNSDGISILQLIHFEDQDQLEDKLALNGADADYYNFNDISTPTNSQFWDNRDSNIAIRAVSEAGQRMEAYFDVPGPGILVYPKELHENAIVKVTTHYSLDLINTDDIGSPGSGVRVSLQGLDPTFFDYDLPDRDYLIFPKEPFNYTFSVTPKMTCADFVQSGETSYYFNLLVQAEGLHWLENQEIPVKLDLIPGPIELSVTPTERVVQPDFSAIFQAQFANLGWEQKNIALMLKPVPLDDKYLAYPDQIQPEWIPNALYGYHLGNWNSFLKPCGENSIIKYFSLMVPGDSYAAIEDAVYEFDVIASPYPYSIETPDAGSVRCQITIRATAQSMLNYVKYYGGRLLQKDFTTMSVSLQAKAKSIIEKSELAILKHEKGLLGVTENMLNAVKNKTDAFINEVEAQTGKSLSFDEATLLINEAEQIKMFVDTTIEALPFSFDIGDITIKRNLKN